MNEQISPSQELVNKMISSISIDESPKTAKKSRKDWKFIIKFALPALMVLSIFCFQIIGPGFWGNTKTESGNWFSLVVYAEDMTTVEIPKDIKIKLPGNYFHWGVMTYSDGVYSDGRYSITLNTMNDSITLTDDHIYGVDGWKEVWEECEYLPFVIIGFTDETDEAEEFVRANRGGFAFEGENIRSVSLESKYGTFSWFDGDDVFTANFYQDKLIILENADISSKWFSWFPTALKNSLNELPVRDPENNDYQQYLTDTVTITVLFDDGEVMTQVVEITIDENTGETFAQIIE